MSIVDYLIQEILNYCSKNFPNVSEVKATEISVDGNRCSTTISLNNRIDFVYIAGTPFDKYDKYFKKA